LRADVPWQLSYKPLGEPNPAIFNLGVAILLVGPLTLFMQDTKCLQVLVILVSATFYAIVDWNASRIMKSIQSLVAHEAAVIRDGVERKVLAADLVVGDVVLLSLGDRVPADMRIIRASADVKFDRSLLTGERCTSNFLPVFEMRIDCRYLLR
jgi:sodium/potassium-transporting ATPase subunit alpha